MPLVLLLLAASLAQAPATPLPAPVPVSTPTHICWIDRVVAEGDGVRVLYRNRPPEGGEHARIGEVLSPANSGHDLCAITAARRGRTRGVWARASFFMPGLMKEPQERREWIAADPAR